MKIGQKIYDRRYGCGVVHSIDEYGYYIMYKRTSIFYEWRNLEKTAALIMWIVSLAALSFFVWLCL